MGAGKSTLMNMLEDFLNQQVGEIVVEWSGCKLDSPSKTAGLGVGWFTNILCWLKLYSS